MASRCPARRRRSRFAGEKGMRKENIKLVRELWSAVRKGGVEAALELTPADVEWAPHQAEGRVLSSGELLKFLAEFRGERETLHATLYSFRSYGDHVLASGSFRLQGARGLSEFQVHWVYRFEGSRLVRATSYPTQADALEAIGAEPDHRPFELRRGRTGSPLLET
jgi:ketosteroid isomerase-like protein